MVFVYTNSYCVTLIAANFKKWTLHRTQTHTQSTNHGWMVKKRRRNKILLRETLNEVSIWRYQKGDSKKIRNKKYNPWIRSFHFFQFVLCLDFGCTLRFRCAHIERICRLWIVHNRIHNERRNTMSVYGFKPFILFSAVHEQKSEQTWYVA